MSDDHRTDPVIDTPRSESYAEALVRVDARWDAARTERALASLHRRRTRRRAGTVLAGVLLLTSGSALGAWRASSERPTTLAWAEGVPTARVVRLADGSRVVPEEGAHVIVEHVTDALIAVRVDHGAAEIEVVPGMARRFEVRAGPVTVRVLGTSFRVERLDGARTFVAVQRGHVDVAWAGGHAELVSGDEGVFPGLAPTIPRPAEPHAVEPAAIDPERIGPGASTPHRARASRAGSASDEDWRALARASRYDEAYAALGPPAARAAAVTDAVDDLLLAADVARLSGHPREALPWLEAVERDHASDPRAALASFTRGRILAELGRPAEAARQLERVLELEPGGSLAEDALARAALAHAAAGDTGSAAALAERYLASHPEGRWVRRLRAIAGIGATPPR